MDAKLISDLTQIESTSGEEVFPIETSKTKGIETKCINLEQIAQYVEGASREGSAINNLKANVEIRSKDCEGLAKFLTNTKNISTTFLTPTTPDNLYIYDGKELKINEKYVPYTKTSKGETVGFIKHYAESAAWWSNEINEHIGKIENLESQNAARWTEIQNTNVRIDKFHETNVKFYPIPNITNLSWGENNVAKVYLTIADIAKAYPDKYQDMTRYNISLTQIRSTGLETYKIILSGVKPLYTASDGQEHAFLIVDIIGKDRPQESPSEAPFGLSISVEFYDQAQGGILTEKDLPKGE